MTMARYDIDGLQLELVTGDITDQEGFDAVVNAANAELMPGGGVAGAIHRSAGPELAEACRPLAPIQPGQAVVTEGFALPNPYVIHCLGPIYGRDEPAHERLAECYQNALNLAEERSLESIAFPAISTGAFGYPVEEAARVALRTIGRAAPQLKSLRRIRFVLFDDDSLVTHERAAREVLPDVA